MKHLLAVSVAVIFFSCNNKTEKAKAELLHNFDSIRLALEKTDTLLPHSSTYDLLVGKLTEESGKWRQFYYRVHDFYGYIDNVQWRFETACSDSVWEDNVEITNRFFADSKNTSAGLYGYMKSVIEDLHTYAVNDSVCERISAFDQAVFGKMRSMEEMKKVYFRNVPPVAVITILNSFEQKIRNLELLVLQEHYKIQ